MEPWTIEGTIRLFQKIGYTKSLLEFESSFASLVWSRSVSSHLGLW